MFWRGKLRRLYPLIKKTIIVLSVFLIIQVLLSLYSEGKAMSQPLGETILRRVIAAELGETIPTNLDPFTALAADDAFNGIFADAGCFQIFVSDDAAPSPSPPLSIEPEAIQIPSSPVESDPSIRTITIAPSSPSGYNYGSGVYIKNETAQSIDVDSYLSAKPAIDFKDGEPLILIVHTHTSESYYPEGDDIYIPTDTERTEDKNYNMVRIGDTLSELIESYGYRTIHIRDIFDYPSYTGSYTRTLSAIEKALKEYPSIRMVIDVHRDAMIAANGSTYRTVTDIDDKKAAQIMLVVGTSEGGLSHPEWKKNLTFAIHLQKQLVDDNPLLMRPINLRKERFNQHATNRSLLVEMGTSGNTLQEALYSTELFAKSLCNLLDSLR